MPPNASSAPKSSAEPRHSSSTHDIAEWADALADIPNTAVIDMGGGEFGCDPLRIFPDNFAGSYWLDYMVPMIGPGLAQHRRSNACAPCSPRRTPPTRHHSTAALMSYIASIQAPLRRRRQPATSSSPNSPTTCNLCSVALHSWATYDFTAAIFDDTLPVPDLSALDVTIG